ncbi:GPP34 family phosphoprotein [Streptomyces sp. ISL-10]|uniref:GOLPH3/VPS74 family protein n=1 Tax=Streptomyces sp. ISL-10 TaxID=2819172 RepID=UPI001BEB3ECB|nr:GPP34 family phosphoprotein [Streptomyces sp. ISL-10]MBT2366410.1 GPP34 family phosphoprotein [Streptomyces sp. ISL-10]
MTVTLAEEIMLLSLDDESGAAKDKASAAWAVAGGILLDLALAGRVAVADKRLRTVDPTPTDVPLLDERLRKITDWSANRRSAKVAAWLTKDQSKAPRATLDSLVSRGLVAEERRHALGIFPVRRYPEADGSVERELRGRLSGVVLHGGTPDDRTTGLIALLHGAKLHRIAFPDVPRKRVEARMAQIADGQWAGDGVREAIRDMQAAMVTVTVVTLAAAAG